MSLTISTSISKRCAASKLFRDPLLRIFLSSGLWTSAQAEAGSLSPSTSETHLKQCPVVSRYLLNRIISHSYLQRHWTCLLHLRLLQFPHHTVPKALQSLALGNSLFSHPSGYKLSAHASNICILASIFTEMRTKAFKVSHCALIILSYATPVEEFSRGKGCDGKKRKSHTKLFLQTWAEVGMFAH